MSIGSRCFHPSCYWSLNPAHLPKLRRSSYRSQLVSLLNWMRPKFRPITRWGPQMIAKLVSSRFLWNIAIDHGVKQNQLTIHNQINPTGYTSYPPVAIEAMAHLLRWFPSPLLGILRGLGCGIFFPSATRCCSDVFWMGHIWKYQRA